MADSLPKLDTIKDTAEMYGLDPQHVYRMVNAGVIQPGVAIRVGRRWFIHRQRFIEWLEAGGAGYDGGWRRAA